MNKSYSLHKIKDEKYFSFEPTEYSLFKFGDNSFAEKFGEELFDGFIKIFGDTILENEEIILFPSPYFAIPTASNFLCYHFKKNLNEFLFKNSKKACVESKIYRNQTYVTDYGNLDFDERVKLISNDTYYIDKTFIDKRLCLFVDDIKITGSHEYTVNKILDQYNVEGNYIFVYFAELTNKAIHPRIENYFNYFAINTIDDIISVINKPQFKFNTRIIKYILNLSEELFTFLLNEIPSEKRDEIFHLSISNNYHQISEYKPNINSIRLN